MEIKVTKGELMFLVVQKYINSVVPLMVSVTSVWGGGGT